MKLIPLKAVPNQNLSMVLSNQFVGLDLRQTIYGMFMNVYLDGTLVIGGVICQNRNWIVRSAYLGFSGDFFWNDTQGLDDPDYTDIGDGGRFQLFYATAAEVSQLKAS